jgi:serine/threonine protein kinase
MAIKDYEIIKQIGSGGMGAIFLARDPRLDRLVAIKKTRIPNNLEKEVHSEMIQRFYREARAIANINHPNIVTVYDLGEDENTNECFMIMEYLDGKAMDRLIDEQKTLSLNLSLKIGIQICEALNYLHQKQIVHRDIKPANIMYCSNGMAKLVDFGLVRVDDNLDLTRAGTLLGSVLYMSPEQIKNPKDIDNKVDIYAFGVTMYQALSGKFPYDGDNVWEIIRKVTLEEPIPLSKLNPEIPFTIEKAIMKAIAKDKNERYSDIALLQNDLVNYNNSKVQTIISPLNYSRGTGQLPSLDLEPTTDKTVIHQMNNYQENNVQSSESFIQTQMLGFQSNEIESAPLSTTMYKGAYKPDNYFNKFKPDKNILNKENNQIKIKISDEKKEQFIHNTKDFLQKEENSSIEYPTFEQLIEFSNETKNKIIKINEVLSKEINSLKPVVEKLNKLNNELQNDSNLLQTELKSMISLYNVSSKTASVNNDIKDLKRKIDYKKSQKISKDNDSYLLKDKLNVYSNLLKFKSMRIRINKFILQNFESQHKNGFFNCDSIFKLTDLQADSSKDTFTESIESIKNIDIFNNESTHIIEFLKKTLNSMKIIKDASIGKIIKFLPKNYSLEVILAEECDNNLLLEIDLGSFDILFTYCQMTRNERPVPKFQAGDIVNIFSENFDDSLKSKINSSTNIYKSKSRIYKKDIIEYELNQYLKILDIIKLIQPTIQCDIEKNFEQLIEMFSDIDTSEEITQDKRQSSMVKINKIKKSILDLKKDLEQEEDEIKSYIKYINPILLSLNRFPTLIKNYEDDLKSKKEHRKRLVSNILLQISKTNPEALKEQKNSILKNISVLNDMKVPLSIQKFLTFYVLSKSRFPTEISKNQLIDMLNDEKNLLSATEIDWVCRLLSLNFNKDKGFILKI